MRRMGESFSGRGATVGLWEESFGYSRPSLRTIHVEVSMRNDSARWLHLSPAFRARMDCGEQVCWILMLIQIRKCQDLRFLSMRWPGELIMESSTRKPICRSSVGDGVV